MLDYIVRLLGFEYLKRTDLVQVPPKEDSAVTPEALKAAAEVRSSSSPLETKELMFTELKTPAATTSTNGAAAQQVETEDAAQHFLSSMMGDAPACDVCGHITIRNGTCYKCLNCGNSLGCS